MATKTRSVCNVCGCTNIEGCPQGCYWPDADQTICSECFYLTPAQRSVRRRESFNRLTQRLRSAKMVMSRLRERLNRLGERLEG